MVLPVSWTQKMNSQIRCDFEMKMKPNRGWSYLVILLPPLLSPVYISTLQRATSQCHDHHPGPRLQYKLFDPDPIHQLTTLSGKSSKTSICSTFLFCLFFKSNLPTRRVGNWNQKHSFSISIKLNYLEKNCFFLKVV